jgi:hypothetical protein
MNQDNRVLGRKGARELNMGELQFVQGAIIPHTTTACSLGANGQPQFFDTGTLECSSDSISDSI